MPAKRPEDHDMPWDPSVVNYRLLGGPCDGHVLNAPQDLVELVIQEPESGKRHQYKGFRVATLEQPYREFLAIDYVGEVE
jgi:hypothetical protein